MVSLNDIIIPISPFSLYYSIPDNMYVSMSLSNCLHHLRDVEESCQLVLEIK